MSRIINLKSLVLTKVSSVLVGVSVHTTFAESETFHSDLKVYLQFCLEEKRVLILNQTSPVQSAELNLLMQNINVSVIKQLDHFIV